MIDQSAGTLSAVHGRHGVKKPGSNPGDKVTPKWSRISDSAVRLRS